MNYRFQIITPKKQTIQSLFQNLSALSLPLAFFCPQAACGRPF
jgi:hypothetical protein